MFFDSNYRNETLFNLLTTLFQLTVDNIAMHTRIESGGTRYLDLSDSFYLGGIDSEKQQRAFTKGIKAADSSIMVSFIVSLIRLLDRLDETIHKWTFI